MEKPLNNLPKDDDSNTSEVDLLSTSCVSNNSNNNNSKTQTTSPRQQYSKLLSMTSTTYNSNNIPSNDLLSNLNNNLCFICLELVMTLLASQTLLSLKDMHLSLREKQLIRRELSTEMSIFHDFVKKRIHIENKHYLMRKKYGIVMIASDYSDNDDDGDDDCIVEEGNENQMSEKQGPPVIKSTVKRPSMREHVVRKLHLQQHTPPQQESSKKQSPLNFAQDISPIRSDCSVTSSSSSSSSPCLSSRSISKGSLKKPSDTSVPGTNKRVIFSDDITIKKVCTNDSEIKYTGLSYVQLVEEDYFHFLSNLFLIICQTEN